MIGLVSEWGGMELVYRNDLKDMMEFFKYHHLQSPAGKKSVIRGYFTMSFVFILGCSYSIYFNDKNIHWSLLLGGVTMGAIVLTTYYRLIWPLYIWLYIKFHMRKTKNKGFGESIELLISDDYLHVKNANSEAKLKISDLERVVEFKGYTYVYTGPFTAFYIPEEKVSSGDYSAFCKELGSVLEDSA